MCIIITKERNQVGPTLDDICNALDNNPDGYGLAYSSKEGASPVIVRTMHKKEIRKAIEPILNKEGVSWILHARIATHGSKKEANCHCWVDEGTGLVFAHNGVLSIANEGDMTDSETAFRRLLVPAFAKFGGDGFNAAVKAIIGTSKFAVMDCNGTIIRYGKFLEEKEASYSNNSYSYGYKKKKSSYCGGWGGWGGWGNSYRGYSSLDDDDEYLNGNYEWDQKTGTWALKQKKSTAVGSKWSSWGSTAKTGGLLTNSTGTAGKTEADKAGLVSTGVGSQATGTAAAKESKDSSKDGDEERESRTKLPCDTCRDFDCNNCSHLNDCGVGTDFFKYR